MHRVGRIGTSGDRQQQTQKGKGGSGTRKGNNTLNVGPSRPRGFSHRGCNSGSRALMEHWTGLLPTGPGPGVTVGDRESAASPPRVGGLGPPSLQSSLPSMVNFRVSQGFLD